MTYRRLFHLKFVKGISTYELVQRFPRAIDRVSAVALLDVPEATLREVIKEEKELNRLMKLKKRFGGTTATKKLPSF